MKQKICPKCGMAHNKTGIYCTRSCANSRKCTDEAKERKSIANKQYWKTLSKEERTAKLKILSSVAPRSRESFLPTILYGDWEFLGIESKRIRVILEQQGKCNKCSISDWMSQPITLEYEHKDGNNTNNARVNVEALCPNCHSQTDTWRGRKNGKNQNKVLEYLKHATNLVAITEGSSTGKRSHC